MTDSMIKVFVINWALQIRRPTLMEAFVELVDLHEGLLESPPYWPQMRELIRDLSTEM